MITPNDTTLLKTAFTFFDHLNSFEQELLLSNTMLNTFPAGQIMHCGNSNCLGVLLIKKGTLRTYLLSEEGKEVTLYRLDSNDICILSASCILQAITFDVYIEAETDCEVLTISSSIFSKITAQNIYAENFSYKLVTERFSEVMWAMQQLLFISFDKRLASFLLDESLKKNSDTLELTHEQIAKYLGSAREVVSRMLQHFSKEGFVLLKRGGITLVDKQKMRELTK